eukprot:CAMPEP_0206430630 /NCGR_PEP_ID=MMETSP0324_2-20121206/6923_1 /ASSEMBLY_ACC=CAM_ASM_000836 /TAXON_ID=2866 /ORGANISM="Crypthecodinium cohnii, Strain Seligo" /LENGTH=519 /DNA_ID=CAMNT_0053896483 /DNA_START=315 /DNA_END=1871 /DNA_ORIENTATION=-
MSISIKEWCATPRMKCRWKSRRSCEAPRSRSWRTRLRVRPVLASALILLTCLPTLTVAALAHRSALLSFYAGFSSFSSFAAAAAAAQPTSPVHAERRAYPNRTAAALRSDRQRAERYLRQGQGYVWFQHMRRAGGTNLCGVLQTSTHANFFRGQACQPMEWNLRDAFKFNNHSLPLLEAKLEDWGTNSFAQEYGPAPGLDLAGDKVARTAWRRWVFVTSLRDPWKRFWSQLRHEMTPCLAALPNLRACAAGKFEAISDFCSPFSHVDAILGVPSARLSESPRVYVDNYYTRVLVNKTDPFGPPLTDDDVELAKDVLNHRFSAVIISDYHSHSSLQLVCALGINLTAALPKLRQKTRPYAVHESWFADLPETEWDMGPQAAILNIRTKFVRRNLYDYTLIAYAKQMADQRLRECARQREDVRELLQEFTKDFVPAPPNDTDLEPEVDGIFGCSGASISWNAEKEAYLLVCPRSPDQSQASWWDGEAAKLPGEECWSEGYDWKNCCHPIFGPRGNSACWDK